MSFFGGYNPMIGSKPTPQRGDVRSTVLALSMCTCASIMGSGCGQDMFTAIPVHQEEFTQNTAAKIDALWVVDNSESMAEEQTGLGQSFQAFIANLIGSTVDYHIGVISTDPGQRGKLHTSNGIPFIDRNTPQAQNAFISNVAVGTNGSRLEMGFESATRALGKGPDWSPGKSLEIPTENQGFLRADASLFIIMVSDEDDKSFGPVGYYARLFESIKGTGNEALVSVSAIAGPADTAAAQLGCFAAQRGFAQPGFRYQELAIATGGIVTSICDDFNASLAQLSITAAGLKAVFPLRNHPNRVAPVQCTAATPQTICVTVNGVVIPESADRHTGWRYDDGRNAIVFGTESIPPPQAVINVLYES